MTINRILEEKYKDKLKMCKQFCSYLCIGEHSDILLFSDEQIAKIDECISFQNLQLHKHWSCEEYSILKGIIALCDSREAETEVGKFEKFMAVRCGMNLISEKYSHNELPEKYINLLISINKPYGSLTLKDYDELRTFIFQYLDVKKYVALPFIKFLLT